MDTCQITSTSGISKAPSPLTKPDFDEAKFFPRGAIAFFIALVVLGLIFWFAVYFLMLHRI